MKQITRAGYYEEIAGKVIKNAYYGDKTLTGYAFRKNGMMMLETKKDGKISAGMAHMIIGQLNAA